MGVKGLAFSSLPSARWVTSSLLRSLSEPHFLHLTHKENAVHLSQLWGEWRSFIHSLLLSHIRTSLGTFIHFGTLVGHLL